MCPQGSPLALVHPCFSSGPRNDHGNARTGGTELSDFDSFLDSLFTAASKRGGGREAREETILFIGTINYKKTLALAARPVIAEITVI